MSFGAAKTVHRLAAVALFVFALGGRADDLGALREAVGRGDWAAAEGALPALDDLAAADRVEALFLSGMMWAARNELPRAEAAFRQLVEARPDLPRPRLELARILFLQGDDEAARQQFERVLAAEVPAAVADNVRSFVDAIRQRRAWSFDLTLAPVADDNLNGGTSRDTVDLGGLSFNVNPDARAVRGNGLITALRARQLIPAGGPWRHELSGNLLLKRYNKDEFDDTFFRFGYGFRRLLGVAGVEAGGGVFVTDRRVGEAPFSRSRGVRLDLRWPGGRAWSIDGAVERQWVDYHANAPRDGTLTWVALGAQIGIDAATIATLGLDRLREQAADPAFRLTSLGVNAALYRDLPWAITLGPNLRQATTSYDEAMVLFGQRRRDIDRSLGIYLAKKDWLLLGLHPSLHLSRERRQSSIDFFDYRRKRYLLAFERRF